MIEQPDESSISCSNCNAPLVVIWPKPSEEGHLKTKVVALCPHCGDKSYSKEIFGKFYVGATDYTGLDSMESDESDNKDEISVNIIIKTIKAKNYE